MATMLVSEPAFAQSDEDRASARAAATAGAAAFDEGKWSDAIDLFTRAESLVHAPPHLLFIARANVELKRLVRARENYLKITREVLPASAPKAFVDAQASASTELAALEPRIPTIKLTVEGEGAASAKVLMDGDKPTVAGVQVPIDPGKHVFVARTNKLTSDEVTVALAEREQKVVVLPLKNAVAQAAVPPTEAGTAPTSPTEPPSPPPPEGTNTLRLASYGALGVGVVGVAIGTVFLAKNHSARDDVEKICPNNQCPESQRSKVDSLDADGDSAATLSLVGYGVGIVGLGAGAALFFLSGKKAEPKSARLHPIIGTTYWGVAGSF